MHQSVLFGILLTILNNKKVTVNELSLKYEISRRTVLRCIDALDISGVPVITYKGRNGGIAIADNYKLDRVFFTKEEMERLITCVNGMQELFNDHTSLSLKEKIGCISVTEEKQVLATDTVLIDAGPWGDIRTYRDKFTALEKAINKQTEIDICYHDRGGSESRRTIQPYTLVFKKGLWYVYAFCLLRQEFRLFKIGRIARITLTDKTFSRQDIDVKSLPYNLKWFENENNIDVVLKISPEIKSDVEEWLSFENVKQNSDGSIYAFARLPESGLVNQILSYGNRLEVLEPASLRRRIRNTVKGIEKIYRQDAELPETNPDFPAGNFGGT
jgi:predicted DNA-binding transcriptional regulator YafY